MYGENTIHNCQQQIYEDLKQYCLPFVEQKDRHFRETESERHVQLYNIADLCTHCQLPESYFRQDLSDLLGGTLPHDDWVKETHLAFLYDAQGLQLHSLQHQLELYVESLIKTDQ